jgi:hypothetical protein
MAGSRLFSASSTINLTLGGRGDPTIRLVSNES